MRVDLCRKCGNLQQKFRHAERCNVCGDEFTQFICRRCESVTEPQYHVHAEQMPLLSTQAFLRKVGK